MLPVSSDSAASMVMREATLLQPATTHAVLKDERRAVQADTPGVELTQPLQPAFRGPGCAAGPDLETPRHAAVDTKSGSMRSCQPKGRIHL
jgi:hypothetical protein